MKKIILAAVILLSSTFSFPQKQSKIDAFKYVKQDTVTALTPAKIAELALKIKDRAYQKLNIIDRKNLDKQLIKLTDPDSIKRSAAAFELSSAAMFMMAASKSKEVAIVLCTAPVEIRPSNTLLVNNFCSLLRMLDSIKLSLPILVYAKNIFPSSPIILTNLGNTLFELYDDRNAEIFYKRALGIDPHFKEARSSLVSVYLKRKEFGKAYEELMKGVEEVIYHENTKVQFGVASNNEATKKQTAANNNPPPPPAGPQGSSSSGNSGNGTPDKLVLPPFPEWVDLKAFMNAKGPGSWDKEIQKGLSNCIQDLQEAGKKRTRKMINGNYMQSPFYKIAERNEYGMKVMEQYIDDRSNRIWKDYKETEEKNGEKFNKSFAQISDAFAKHSQAISKEMETKLYSVNAEMEKAAQGAGITKNEANKIGSAAGDALSKLPEYQKLMADYCKQTKQLTEDHFFDWKKNIRTVHNKTNDLLQEYWVYCEQYLNQVYAEDYEWLNTQRMMFVYGKLAVLSGAYTVMPLAFMTTGFSLSSGDCPEATAMPAVTSAEADMTTTVPKKTGPPCPWENGKLQAGIGPCSCALDCSSIEVECLEGVGAAAKWDWKVKQVTLTPEIGWKWEAKAGTNKVGELSIKTGASITFDKNGQLVDDGIHSFVEAGASVNSGTLSVGGSAKVYTAVAGLNSELTYAVAVSH